MNGQGTLGRCRLRHGGDPCLMDIEGGEDVVVHGVGFSHCELVGAELALRIATGGRDCGWIIKVCSRRMKSM